MNDPIITTLTTKGYLSNGNSHSINIRGMFGDDLFDVARNLQPLDLDGNSGDDLFVIRSFIALVINSDGTTSDPALGELKLGGSDGNDSFDIRGNDPDYVVNSLVDVDGGTGDDRMVVVGTESDDSYVVTDGQVLGGGLTIKHANIEILEVSCEEGNDLVSVLSTHPALVTNIYGARGSDTFQVAPRRVNPVISKNLRGHRGILEHTVDSADDAGYHNLPIEGIAVDVLDNDGRFGYIRIVEDDAVHLVSEDGIGTFQFTVFPTRPIEPGKSVWVDFVTPSDSQGEEVIVSLNDRTDAVLALTFTSTAPQTGTYTRTVLE